MASLHPPALLPLLCCSSHTLLDSRTRSHPPKFSNGTCSMARSFGRTEFLGKSVALASRTVAERQRRRLSVAGAGRGPFFRGGGRRMDRGTGRLVGNLAFAALLTYLAVTDQFRWVLDAIVSLWLLTILLPILAVAAFFFFAGQAILQGDCPNCGKRFQILKSALKDGPQVCPYCTQPFSVQGNKFVRESATFSSGRGASATTTAQVLNELLTRGAKGKAPSGTQSWMSRLKSRTPNDNFTGPYNQPLSVIQYRLSVCSATWNPVYHIQVDAGFWFPKKLRLHLVAG